MAFNEQQQLAINSTERTILCLAGAGAGKSTVMVNRIKRLVDAGVKPWQILALTFTNAAAFEMAEKYKKIATTSADKIPEFRTFHGFCYSLLVKDKDVRERLGYVKVPEVCDEKEIKQIEQEVKLMTRCTLSDAQLTGQLKLTAQQKFSFDLYMKALRKKIREANKITFDMLCNNICEMFVKDEECVKRYKEKYQHIFVDEFQDTDPRQFKFLCSFPETSNFFFVGDSLQCIYQFRNCTNEFVKTLSVAPGWKVIKMPINYRSTKQICEFANKMSTYAKPEYRIEMIGQRDGNEVEVIRGSHVSYSNPVDSYHLDLLIKKLKASEEESAVLVRTNREVTAILERLREEGMQYTTSNKSSDVAEVLNSVLDNGYMLGWLSSMLEGKDYSDYIRLSSQQESVDIRWFLSAYENNKKITDLGKKIVKIRKIATSEESTEKKFSEITKLLKIKSKCKIDKSTQYTNKQLIENIRDQIEEQEGTKLYVGTIHSSKGLEYEHVYLLGVDDGVFELDTEEMKNLYYVGITRAKNNLTVFRY